MTDIWQSRKKRKKYECR